MSVSRRTIIFLAACLAVLLCVWAARTSAPSAPPSISRGPWEASFTQAKGLHLSYDGVPIIRRPTLFHSLCAPSVSSASLR
jgi:hypothetical protein